jgi:hypothetical protein
MYTFVFIADKSSTVTISEKSVPIFIAGGTANCIMRTYRYIGSLGKNPNSYATFTTQIPIMGRTTNRMKIMATIARCLITDLWNPCVRFPPRIRVMTGMVPFLQCKIKFLEIIKVTFKDNDNIGSY